MCEIPHFVYSIVFTLYLLYLKYMIKTEAMMIDEKTLTTSDFAI